MATGFGRKNKVYVAQTIQAVNNNYNNMNDEEYGKHKENRFISVSSEPLSTFSLDVDAASYGNIRRIINQEKCPIKMLFELKKC
jgi:Ca-activated chloride channel family protein